MQTTITYNGVAISLTQTNSWASETIWDESRTIARGTRHTLGYTGIIHQRTTDDASESLKLTQDRLSEPRKTLTIQFGTTDTRTITAARGGLDTDDIENGPIPSNVSVSAIRGGLAMFVTAMLTWTEPVANADDAKIISHRYTSEWRLNDADYSEVTRSGTLILSGRFPDIDPDDFRCHIWPDIPSGFQRTRGEFIVGADGVSLSYSTLDVERYRTYPKGIIKAQGSATVTMVGAAVTKSVSFRLEAAKRTSTAMMIVRAFRVLQSRIRLGKDVVRSISITEDLWNSNSITVSATAQGPVADVGFASFDPVALGLFTRVGNIEGIQQEGKFRSVTPYGSALVKAAATAFFDPVTMGDPATPGDFADRATNDQITGPLIDTDDDGIPDSPCSGWKVFAAEAVNDETTDLVLTEIGSGASLVSESQLSNPIIESSVVEMRSVRNNVLMLSLADPTAPDLAQQLGAPVVRETVRGRVKRMGAPPDIPSPERVARERGGVVIAYDIMPMAAEVPAGQDPPLYTTEYEFTLDRQYGPNLGTFAEVSVPLPQGFTTLIGFAGGRDLRAPQSPVIIDDAARTAAIAPTGPIV